MVLLPPNPYGEKGQLMLLQLIVPHWQERADEMEPLLDSIKLQQAVDFNEIGVIIVYDGDEATPLPETEWAERYPFKILHLHKDHGGVSAARNYGLDHATADYIMFCDADDMFCHVCGIRMIFDQMDKGFDTMTSAFIEETKNPHTMKPLFVVHEQDTTFVHGKIHRLAFLRENNLRFRDELKVHEDSYFNVLVQSVVEEGKGLYCPEKFYLWKWRDNSICRHDRLYMLKTFPAMLDSNDALIDELLRRGLNERASAHVGMMIFDSYYTLNRKEWLEQTNKEYRDKTEKRLSEYFKMHEPEWNALPDEEKLKTSVVIRTRCISSGMPMETIAFPTWLERIRNL